MAIIGKIRKRGGIIVVIIGIALAAFVLGDFWKKGNKGGSHKSNLGEICGEKITYLDFEKQVDAQVDLVKQQSGEENLTADQLFQIRDELWTKLERDFILGQEYDELGIAVSADELSDMVQGQEPHQYIVQNFTDPQTGQFNVAQVRMFMQNLEQYEQKSPGTKAQWENLLETIEADRLYTKYLNLVKQGYYMPTALAKKDYEQKNTKAVFRFVAEKYATIPDASVTVTDADYQKYYDEHKQEYILDDASRDVEFITYDVVPSDSDIAFASREVEKIYVDMKVQEEKDLPLFVTKYSDESYDSSFYKKGVLPEVLDTVVFAAKKGDVLGPFFMDNVFTIARVMEFQERPDSMRASHILIAYTGSTRAAETVTRTKEQAEKIVDSLITVLKKSPKQFDTIAKSLSDDPTAATKAGDLDWFADGAMVGPFNEACVTGKIDELQKVETPFGYHIIKVTDKKKNVNKVRLAVISRTVEPSKETYQTEYDLASKFAGENTTAEAFEKSVIDNKLNKRLAENLTPMTNTITGLESPREIVKWAYAETAKKGDVSGVFDLQTKYVVACLKEVREKGIPPLEQVKTQLEPYVKREKKAETLLAKVKGLITAGITLDALAEKLDSVSVDTLDFITFSSYSIPGYGPEPEILGKLFTLKTNVLSEPLKGKAGVFVIQVDSIIRAPEIKDYKTNITQTLTTFKSRATYDVYNALEKNAVIEDNRILFY
jgi:peptidyl-prolyl cis-trans isomerase D